MGEPIVAERGGPQKGDGPWVLQAVVDTVTLDAAGVRAPQDAPDGADARLTAHGPNVLAKDQRPGLLELLWHAVWKPLLVLLAVLATVSFATGDPRAATMMLLMIALSVVLKLRATACARPRRGSSPVYPH